MRVVYLSHTGMTEPLGQSQVLPYLRGLTRRGADIEVLSFEPVGTSPGAVETLRDGLRKDGIVWRPLVRSSSHAFSMKLYEAGQAVAGGLVESLRKRAQIIHARSYLPAAAAAVVATLSPGARFLFDNRGMVGDEYVDGGHWKRESASYRIVKRVERVLFDRADGLVVLTEALRRWLLEHGLVGVRTEMEVVPCCVDVPRFGVVAEVRTATRLELGVADRLVVVYSGTLGSWYRENEMARLVGRMRALHPKLTFLVLSRAPTDGLRAAALAAGLREHELLIRSAAPAEMPDLLSAGDLGLSLIDTCFSKIGSSPTKVAEYLAAGLPVVVNAGIGDQTDLRKEAGAAVVIDDLSSGSVDAAAAPALALALRAHAERAATTVDVARRHFGLDEVGIPRYLGLYERLVAKRAS